MKFLICNSFLAAAVLAISTQATALVMYTDRPATTTQIIVDAFNAKYPNEELEILNDTAPNLIARLKAEGAASNGADVIFVKDLVYLNEINAGGFFQPYTVPLTSTVNATMKTNTWVSVTYRTRVVIYNKTSVTDPTIITSYADLAKDEWAGALCLRSSNSSYNEALVANLIVDFGEAKTQQILNGWVSNLAKDSALIKDDMDVIKAVAAGECDVGIVNSYYMGRALAAAPQLPVGLAFVEAQGNGTHTNGSGIGISASSTQVSLANQLIEVMLSEDVQTKIVGATFEFPANNNVVHPVVHVNAWLETFKTKQNKINGTNWQDLAPYIEPGKTLIHNAGYN